MGRHGTGGAEDPNDQGDASAFWGPHEQQQQSDSFWGPSKDHPPEPPGWPSPPDQIEVTGQWAPMPQHDGGPASVPRPDPFESTGDFAPPPAQQGSGRGFPDQPFETTGAFTRPSSWDEDPDPIQGAGPPAEFGQRPFDQRQSDPFPQQGSFDQRQSDPFPQQGPFDQRQSDPFPQQGSFDQRQGGPFERPQDQSGAFGPGFDEQQGGRAGAYDPLGAEATARFDQQHPGGEPPAPGDIKVYGESTMAGPPTPAWAEAETGFLASGWSSDEQPEEPEPGRRRARRKPPKPPGPPDGPPSGRGKGRMALLAVAAVAVVLGGTVVGIKMMGSSDGAESCPEGNCAAVQVTNQPVPQSEEPVEDTEPAEEPVDEPEEETPAASPTPSVRPTAGQPRRTSTPTPKPTRSKTKQARPTEDPVEEAVPEESPEATPTEEAPPPGDTDSGTVPTEGGTPEPGASTPPAGGSVNVRFNVVKQRLTGYTATMDVINSSAKTLSALTLSMPVRGQVLNVDGAEWTQDGNLLIIDLASPIAKGDTAEITISATGRAGQPSNCGLVGGECAVA